ncbi:MAG: ABC transporter ATP-binding protein [Candidatus Magnetobacterium sp. LHC-1]|uniref:ABC transporter ATP-binding protein n=1 Tax=Candidatus Magnetobacterium casense TaxID=1455061 RepID=A0ABS6S244_9BACT|nr:ABC transporter ATP-binding protein [Candidatus Magnetobacterium casensis]MBF0607306.1 ABC transporter ATP-binding protein [Nitrospirota bacterium]MBV6342876.1 ABC transporter ATP-binding protein [Candidatus Magnetobacterium casensis]
MEVLKVEGLSIYFKNKSQPSIRVVSAVDFGVDASEVFGIVGESGCGKSITAYAIMSILPDGAFYEGDIRFQGKGMSELTAEGRRQLRGNRISMVFQEPMTSLNPVLTIGYQIAEVLMTHKGISRKEATNRAVALLDAVRIPSARTRVNDYPHQLSGGMRQRVMIAMAVACDPALIIADEPTTALDVTIQAQILHLLHGIKEEKNMSMLLITHDLGIIAEHTSKVMVMYAGRVMELSSTQELFKAPMHPYTLGLMNSLPRGRGVTLQPIPGFVPRPDNLPDGCKFSDRCAHVTGQCREAEPPLRELAPGHMVRCIWSC